MVTGGERAAGPAFALRRHALWTDGVDRVLLAELARL